MKPSAPPGPTVELGAVAVAEGGARPRRPAGSPTPSARSTMAFLAARCASMRDVLPLAAAAAPNSGHGGATRSGPARSIGDELRPGDALLGALEAARTRSPGAPSGTNVARPSAAVAAPAGSRWRPTASPPGRERRRSRR